MRYYPYKSETEREIAASLKKRLTDLLAKYEDGPALPQNKAAVRSFIGRFADGAEEAFVSVLRQEVDELDRNRKKYADLRDHLSGLEIEKQSLESKIAKLRKEEEELSQKFADPKAREAFTLYTEVLKTGKGDNGYESCRRITAAGAMAAAFLGLQRYGGGAKENDLEEDAKC